MVGKLLFGFVCLVSVTVWFALLAVSANAGSYQVVPMEQPETRERATLPSTRTLSAIRVYGIETQSTRLPLFGMVRIDWSVEVRALERYSCYVQVHFLDDDGHGVGWDNANVGIPSHSNGFATARGSTYVGIAAAQRWNKTNATAQCS